MIREIVNDIRMGWLFLIIGLVTINALLIQQGLSQSERLVELNKVAITQMRSLLESRAMKRLKG